jgi:hypothetical protein
VEEFAEERKQIGWEMWVRMEIDATVLHEAHRRHVEEAMNALEEGHRRTCTNALLTHQEHVDLPPVAQMFVLMIASTGGAEGRRPPNRSAAPTERLGRTRSPVGDRV